MPELPDLHVFAKNLGPRVIGRRIARPQVFNPAKVNVPAQAFEQALAGCSVASVEREGKELFFTLDSGQWFSVHLMLSGRFSLIPWRDAAMITGKVVGMVFADGEALVVHDRGGLCKAALNPPRPRVPDAMSDAFTLDYFTAMMRKSRGSHVKGVLINQKNVRGIGNAYADEILWKAGISPKSMAASIPQEDMRLLYEAIHWVMADAIENIERLCPGTISGEERGFLRVHRPRKAVAADGEPIICEEIDRKRTYYTKKQRLFV